MLLKVKNWYGWCHKIVWIVLKLFTKKKTGNLKPPLGFLIWQRIESNWFVYPFFHCILFAGGESLIFLHYFSLIFIIYHYFFIIGTFYQTRWVILPLLNCKYLISLNWSHFKSIVHHFLLDNFSILPMTSKEPIDCVRIVVICMQSERLIYFVDSGWYTLHFQNNYKSLLTGRKIVDWKYKKPNDKIVCVVFSWLLLQANNTRHFV